MNHEEQILATLNKMLELQEQSMAIQRQAFENQQQAIAQQKQALKTQASFKRVYLAVISIAALVISFLLFKILPYLP